MSHKFQILAQTLGYPVILGITAKRVTSCFPHTSPYPCSMDRNSSNATNKQPPVYNLCMLMRLVRCHVSCSVNFYWMIACAHVQFCNSNQNKEAILRVVSVWAVALPEYVLTEQDNILKATAFRFVYIQSSVKALTLHWHCIFCKHSNN